MMVVVSSSDTVVVVVVVVVLVTLDVISPSLPKATSLSHESSLLCKSIVVDEDSSKNGHRLRLDPGPSVNTHLPEGGITLVIIQLDGALTRHSGGHILHPAHLWEKDETCGEMKGSRLPMK
ncbi:hypothetical protein E2C01_015600 [Portunus trituberculatus]|uniref:Uncharacterized protein n=1 Tax=Portunus trituberculatus TaxID=210409 RepID=A0A5B7DNG8_PORTR|nr:hypothetical protein [Portunus trituberculatus]